jgi:nucleotide-binding universal stress UspA family protein
MKTIIVPTDFSVPAENAAHYAISLAKKLHADILLCHAYKVPSEAPMAAQVAWPLITEEDLQVEAENSLNAIVKKMGPENTDLEKSDCPRVNVEVQKGEVCKVVTELVRTKKAELVVMGMAGAGQIVQWILGSQAKRMIDEAEFPVLYVPYEAKFKEIRRIGFTTDFSTDDLEHLQYLCKMAEALDAAVVVYHVTYFEAEMREEQQGYEHHFYEEVANKLSFPQLSFQSICHSDVIEGLKYIINEEKIDLIAMVHEQHLFLDKVVNGSYVNRVSRFSKVPLLVFQPCEKIY